MNTILPPTTAAQPELPRTRTSTLTVAQTATLREVVICTDSVNRGTILLLVNCDRCGRRGMHGGGTDPARIGDMLGHRHADCGCPGGYEIVDSHRLLSAVA